MVLINCYASPSESYLNSADLFILFGVHLQKIWVSISTVIYAQETKNKLMSMIGPVQFHYREGSPQYHSHGASLFTSQKAMLQ